MNILLWLKLRSSKHRLGPGVVGWLVMKGRSGPSVKEIEEKKNFYLKNRNKTNKYIFEKKKPPTLVISRQSNLGFGC